MCWSGVTEGFNRILTFRKNNQLRIYEIDHDLVLQDAALEKNTAAGAYGYKQIHELIQNGADAIQEPPIPFVTADQIPNGGQADCINVILTQEALYCANTGSPFSHRGVEVLLHAFLSTKSQEQIGRFGLGFKSVLGVCDSPHIYSRTGSFKFDRTESRRCIQQKIGRDDTDTPVLRLAFPIDPILAFQNDHILENLSEWASTIVKLPLLNPFTFERLATDLHEFPREFLLFSPHVEKLILENYNSELTRVVTCETIGENQHCLKEDNREYFWRLFKTVVNVEGMSEAVRQDIDPHHENRHSFPLLWAVPQSKTEGRFWAFIETTTETTLKGILNAPWKTGADHHNIIPGMFNRHLILKAAELVATNIHQLFDSEDPGSILDSLPARDTKGWEDECLRVALDDLLKEIPSVPNIKSLLKQPSNVKLRPVFNESIKNWIEGNLQVEPDAICHQTVETRERRARATRLGCQVISITEWLECVAKPMTPDASIAAIELAGILITTHLEREEIKNSRFILTDTNTLVAPITEGLFLDLAELVDLAQNILFVHPNVLANEAASTILKTIFHIKPLSPLSLLERILQGTFTGDDDWENLWTAIRAVNTDDAVRAINKQASRFPDPEILGCPAESSSFRIQVRVMSGSYAMLENALHPGEITGEIISDTDRQFVIDTDFHRGEVELLKSLGATNQPRSDFSVNICSQWYREYWNYAYGIFRESLGPHQNPHEDRIVLDHCATWIPINPMLGMTAEAQANYTHFFLDKENWSSTWKIFHRTQPTHYPCPDVDSPVRWLIKHYGALHTSLGSTTIIKAVGPQLSRWKEFFPVALCTDQQTSTLNLPRTLAELNEEHWLQAFKNAESVDDVAALGEFYSEASRYQRVAPSEIRCRKGQEYTLALPSLVRVTHDRSLAGMMEEDEEPFLISSLESAGKLIANWGLKQPLPIRWTFETIGEDEPLLNRFPGLRRHLNFEQHDLILQPCTRIWKESDEILDVNAKVISDIIWQDRLLLFPFEWANGPLLQAVVVKLVLKITQEQIGEILVYLEREERRRLINRIKECDTLAEKLLVALGIQKLIRRLPTYLIRNDIEDIDLARLTLAYFGIEVLKKYSDELRDVHLDPPIQWAGKPRAKDFVTELGFPIEYAGLSLSKEREPYLDQDGPIALPTLHDFQETIVGSIASFLDRHPAERGMLSLPTGAGKTRVVIEGVIRWIKNRQKQTKVLWIADRDELCEQAVQAWSQAWRAFGPDHSMRINRLWGQTNRSCDAKDNASHVVVASFQSLVKRTEDETFLWVFDPDCIVIDEAHRALAPSFTEILEAVGLVRRQTSHPLIGLTATPFRSNEESDETQRLANRFYSQRFDFVRFPLDRYSEIDVYEYLQNEKILATVRHKVLQRDPVFSLTENERSEIEKFTRSIERFTRSGSSGIERLWIFPQSAEERLGRDEARNQELQMEISDLLQANLSWKLLLFATSVEHAQLMASRLTMCGIESCSITGSTDHAIRAYYIKEFKAGNIRVLSNYNVLTTGFDVPDIRAVCIARPIFSKVLYQQMIGRGLRGPRNGGKEECYLINVADNIENYGDQLAFRHFEHLWKSV